jgi:hypothetical protein
MLRSRWPPLIAPVVASYPTVELVMVRTPVAWRGPRRPVRGGPSLFSWRATHVPRNGFANYIVSGGGRDFMRPISQDLSCATLAEVLGVMVPPSLSLV